MENVNLNKESLSIFHMVKGAGDNQLKQLNERERELVINIANSVLTGKELPNVNAKTAST